MHCISSWRMRCTCAHYFLDYCVNQAKMMFMLWWRHRNWLTVIVESVYFCQLRGWDRIEKCSMAGSSNEELEPLLFARSSKLTIPFNETILWCHCRLASTCMYCDPYSSRVLFFPCFLSRFLKCNSQWVPWVPIRVILYKCLFSMIFLQSLGWQIGNQSPVPSCNARRVNLYRLSRQLD